MKHLPKVFVVDDDLPILNSLELLLTTHGYAVRCFASAEEFLAQHHPTQVGCVLVDLFMPDVDGGELIQRLQESGSLLSVVIITGLVDSPETDQHELSVVPLLEKPFAVAALLQMVEDGIAGSIRRRADRLRGGPAE